MATVSMFIVVSRPVVPQQVNPQCQNSLDSSEL